MLGDTGESVADRLGGLGSAVAVGQRGQKGVARDPFGEGRDCRAVTGADNQIAFPVTVVSSYVKIGVGFGGWRWVQMRSEIRRLRTRMASLWVFPRVMSFW